MPSRNPSQRISKDRRISYHEDESAADDDESGQSFKDPRWADPLPLPGAQSYSPRPLVIAEAPVIYDDDVSTPAPVASPVVVDSSMAFYENVPTIRQSLSGKSNLPGFDQVPVTQVTAYDARPSFSSSSPGAPSSRSFAANSTLPPRPDVSPAALNPLNGKAPYLDMQQPVYPPQQATYYSSQPQY